MGIDAISPSGSPSSLADLLATSGTPGVSADASALAAKSQPAVFPDPQESSREAEGEAERLRARREEHVSFLQRYIESYGAPEEKERIQEEEAGREGDEDEKKRVARASKRSQVVEDPEEPGGMKVVVWQKGRDGVYHVSRVHEFDDGRGQDKDDQKAGRARQDDEPPGSRISRKV